MKGEIPPRLDTSALKLLPDAMKQIIFEGKLHIRPVLATRMPHVGQSTSLGRMVDAFQKATTPAKEPRAAVQRTGGERWPTARRHSRGLGCVNCHGDRTAYKSLGMPAPDLGDDSRPTRVRLVPAMAGQPAVAGIRHAHAAVLAGP